MSSLISKNIIVGIINDLRDADMQVKSAITSFYNLLNADLTRSVKREDTLGWELRPTRASPIVGVDDEKMPCIGVEITFGLTTSIMEGEYIDLFVAKCTCKFRKNDPCEFKATTCYDLLVDPVKPSKLEDLTMIMKQYFKECRRMIENIWINQVIETMKMSLGTVDSEDVEETEKEPVEVPRPQKQAERMAWMQQPSQGTNGMGIPMLGASNFVPRAAPVEREGKITGESNIEETLHLEKKEKGGIIRRRNNGGKKAQGEFDLSADSIKEEKIPSPIAAATPPLEYEDISSIKDEDDEDDESPPPIPKLPILDGSKLKQ